MFVIGTLVCAVNAGLTYLGQWLYYGNAGEPGKRVAWVLNFVTIGVGILSYVLFTIGAWQSYDAFVRFAPQHVPGL